MTQVHDTVNTFFDIAGLPKEDQEEFFQDFGDLIMKKIFQKAWTELSGTKKETLMHLLEDSESNPEDVQKQHAIFTFLDENLPTLQEFVAQEVAEIQSTYTEYFDEILDAKA